VILWATSDVLFVTTTPNGAVVAIFGICSRTQVAGFAAGRIVTRMQDEFAFGDGNIISK